VCCCALVEREQRRRPIGRPGPVDSAMLERLCIQLLALDSGSDACVSDLLL
jgi:hypothetical protein